MSFEESKARLGELVGLLSEGWSVGVATMTNGEWYYLLEYDLLGWDYEWYIADGSFEEFKGFVAEVIGSSERN